jgi:two-component system response regulator AtoC
MEPSPSAPRLSAVPNDAPPAGCPYDLPTEGVHLDDVVKGLIEQALQRENGNQSAAARLLGITRYTLRYRMEKYGLR